MSPHRPAGGRAGGGATGARARRVRPVADPAPFFGSPLPLQPTARSPAPPWTPPSLRPSSAIQLGEREGERERGRETEERERAARQLRGAPPTRPPLPFLPRPATATAFPEPPPPSPWIEPTPAGAGGLVPCASPRGAGAAAAALNNAHAHAAYSPPPLPPMVAFLNPAELFGGGEEKGGDAKRARGAGAPSADPPLPAGLPLTPVGQHAPRSAGPSPAGAGRRPPTRLLPFSLVPASAPFSPPSRGSGLADLNARLRASAKAAAGDGGEGGGGAPATPSAPGRTPPRAAAAPATPLTPAHAAAAAGNVRPTRLCGAGASPAAGVRVSRVASCSLGPPAP